MHAKPDLRVFLKWLIARSGSVITDVIQLKENASTMTEYECWENPDGTNATLADSQNAAVLRENGGILSDCVLSYRFTAATSEEASAIFHLRQGYEPYRPMGESAKCATCSSWYYPEGSGECWRCSLDDESADQ